jgi:hypothetical protein
MKTASAYMFRRSGVLPADGNAVPKHAGVDIYQELYFMICIFSVFY